MYLANAFKGLGRASVLLHSRALRARLAGGIGRSQAGALVHHRRRPEADSDILYSRHRVELSLRALRGAR